MLVHLCGLFFLESAVFYNVLEELSSRTVFHYKIEVVLVFNHLIQLNHVRVPDLLEDGYFTVDPIDVRLVFDLVLLKDFYGYFVAS